MEKILKMGVVGCGEIAQIAHIPFLTELPGFQVKAICDVSPKVLNELGDRYGVEKRYQKYEDLVEKAELDAVLVCNRDHADPAIKAMNAGMHVMVEKPMAFNLEQADLMISAARKNQVKLMVAYMKRYDPGFEWALNLYPKIHNVHQIRVHNFGGSKGINQEIYDLVKPTDLSHDTNKTASDKERADMITAIGKDRESLIDAFSLLMYNCSHDANVLQGAFGQPKRILHADIFGPQFVVATLDYGKNTRCIWETGLEPRLSDWDEQFTVYTDKNRITVKFPFPYLKNAATEVFVYEMDGAASIEKKVVASFDEAFKREWRHFYDCVIEDREPITNGEEGKRDIEFLIDLIKIASN